MACEDSCEQRSLQEAGPNASRDLISQITDMFESQAAGQDRPLTFNASAASVHVVQSDHESSVNSKPESDFGSRAKAN